MADNRMRGLLRVANEIEARSRVETDIRPLPSSGADRALHSVASDLAGLGAKIGALADHAAAVEGERAGRLAGLDPEFRPTRALTIRGEAYDRAGLQVAETRLRQEIEADFAAAYQKLQGDPDELARVLDGKARTWLANAPEELRPGLQLLMQGKRLAYMREIARQQAARIAAEQRAALETELGEGIKAIHQRAYALGLDEEADAVLANDLAQLARALERTDVTGKRLVSPEAAAKAMATAREQIATARLLGAFERLPSLKAKERFIAQLDEDFAASRGLAKEFDLGGFRALRGTLEGRLRADRAEASVATRALREEVKSVARVLEKGYAVPPDKLAGLKARVEEAADRAPELAAELAQAEDLWQLQAELRQRRPDEIDTIARAMRAEAAKSGASEHLVARIELADKLAEEARKELKADPLGWAERVGLITVAPLDFSSEETTAATLKARVAQAEEVAAHYGEAAQYLRPDEARLLGNLMAEGGAQTLMLAGAVASAVPEHAEAIMAELGKNAPAVAMLGGLVASAGPTDLARDAADGLALKRTEGFTALTPTGRRIAQARADAIGEALTALPRTEAAAIAIANAAYEIRARRQGLTDFDADLWGRGLREALGEHEVAGETYGGIYYQDRSWFGFGTGAPVVVPPDVKRDRFGELIDTIKPEDLIDPFGAVPSAGDGTPLSMATLRRARLVTVGPARYWLALGDLEDDPQFVMKGSQPFVLDLNALRDTLRRRRPDLYLGGD